MSGLYDVFDPFAEPQCEGGGWPSALERRRLVELCEQQQAAIAARDGRLAEFEAVLGEAEEEIAGCKDGLLRALADRENQRRQLTAARDRHLANGKKLLAETKELRAFYAALEAIRKFPRLKRALSKALHPNAHFSEAGGAEEQRALTEIFQQLAAVFDRIEGRQ